MIGRFAAVVLVFSFLPDCKGEGDPGGAIEKFLAPFPYKPGVHAEMCSRANDGKRYWLDGYLQIPSSLSIRDGMTTLDFYVRLDGNGRGTGRSISIDVASPGDIDDLWASATGKRGSGFRSQKAQIDPDALRIRTKNGPATAQNKIKLMFDVNTIRHFQTGEVTTCTYRFAKAEKV
jgi:hypothetical protein